MKRSVIFQHIRNLISAIAACGLGTLMYNAYGNGKEFWLGLLCFGIIQGIEGYDYYKANNKEYFEKKEAEKYGE